MSRREHEEGLSRCGDVMSRVEGPETAPTFARMVRECSGMFARRACRDALARDELSRVAVLEACLPYCDELRTPPPFCRVEMPTDEEFVRHFGRFSRAVLRRDLRRILDRESAEEIADLYADLVEAQAEQ